MDRPSYIVIAAIVAIIVLASLFVYWYNTRDESEEDAPKVCVIADTFEKVGLMDNFSERNRRIVRELITTVDVVVNAVYKKPAVNNVMEGVDANMDMLLDGVNRDFLIAFILAIYKCFRENPQAQAPELLTDLMNYECFLARFDNDRERLAESLARLINTLRNNVERYEDRFVFRNTNIDVESMVSFRDNILRRILTAIRSLPPITKEELLRGAPTPPTQATPSPPTQATPSPPAATPPPVATPPPPVDTPRPTTVGALLVAKGWRTQAWVDSNSTQNHRNTLIVILNSISKKLTIPVMQSMGNHQLISIVLTGNY